MYGIPKWAQSIRRDLRPNKESIKKLEALRLQYNIPEDGLALRILSSPATTIKVQKDCLSELKKRNPNQSDNMLYIKLLVSRYSHEDLQSIGINKANLNTTVDKISNFNEYCKLVLTLDEKLDVRDPDTFGIGQLIDEILMCEIDSYSYE